MEKSQGSNLDLFLMCVLVCVDAVSHTKGQVNWPPQYLISRQHLGAVQHLTRHKAQPKMDPICHSPFKINLVKWSRKEVPHPKTGGFFPWLTKSERYLVNNVFIIVVVVGCVKVHGVIERTADMLLSTWRLDSRLAGIDRKFPWQWKLAHCYLMRKVKFWTGVVQWLVPVGHHN